MQVFKLFYHFFILVSTITGWVSISEFASLASGTVGIMSFTVGINICAIAAGIKKYKSILKKNKKKHDKIVLLRKKVKYYWSSNC